MEYDFTGGQEWIPWEEWHESKNATSDKNIISNLFKKRNIGFIDLENKIILEATRDNIHDNVIGYSGFSCEFNFDKNGKLENIGIWE